MRETIRPGKRSSSRTVGFVVLTVVLTFLTLWPIVHVILRGGDPGWLPVAVAGAAGLAMMLDRKRQHDDLSVTVYVEDDTEPEPDQMVVIRPEIQQTTSSSNMIKIGKFDLTRDQWQQLGEAIAANNGKLTRDCIPSGIFTNLTKRWPDIRHEFKRLGWIDYSTQQLTDQGVDWLARFSPTLTPISRLNVETPTTTTTTEQM